MARGRRDACPRLELALIRRRRPVQDQVDGGGGFLGDNRHQKAPICGNVIVGHAVTARATTSTEFETGLKQGRWRASRKDIGFRTESARSSAFHHRRCSRARSRFWPSAASGHRPSISATCLQVPGTPAHRFRPGQTRRTDTPPTCRRGRSVLKVDSTRPRQTERAYDPQPLGAPATATPRTRSAAVRRRCEWRERVRTAS